MHWFWIGALCASLGVFAASGCDTEAPSSDPSASGHSSPERIVVDGRFDDWMKVTPLHTDPSGDGVEGGIDLGRLWVGHDRRFVFLRVELGRELNIQDDNALALYLDADNDASTGAAVQGIGAELTWTFGERTGQVMQDGEAADIGHADVGFVTAPTVSSTTFEIALDRHAEWDGEALFSGDTVRLALADQVEGGDRLPDAFGGVAYPMGDASSLAPLQSPPLAPVSDTTLRVMSYNVEFDGVFEEARRPAFRRILQATRPALIGFQEIYDHSADATQEAVESLLPAEGDATWHSAKAGLDLVAVSRYPIRATYEIPGHDDHRSAAFVIDAAARLGTDLLFIVMHPPCCTGGEPPADARRQQVVDQVLAFLREARAEGGPLDLPAGTPVIIAGDMNFVGDAQQPRSLRTGTIVDTARFGPSFAPDWDGTPLADLAPRLTGWPMNFTWYNPESSFTPGRLDYIYYTDSVLEPVRQYALFTPALDSVQRVESGLRAEDVVRASDHLPLILDVTRVE